MSDHSKIYKLDRSISSIIHNETYQNKIFYQTNKQIKRKLKESKNQNEEEKKNKSTIIDELFIIGKDLGLNTSEINEAIELIIKISSSFTTQGTIADVLLLRHGLKYPFVKNIQSFIKQKHLKQIHETHPDLYLAINDPFHFFCRYPNCLSYEYYRTFKYTQILKFSDKNPERYKQMIEKSHQELKDETA